MHYYQACSHEGGVGDWNFSCFSAKVLEMHTHLSVILLLMDILLHKQHHICLQGA